jgi:hypothetical protein
MAIRSLPYLPNEGAWFIAAAEHLKMMLPVSSNTRTGLDRRSSDALRRGDFRSVAKVFTRCRTSSQRAILLMSDGLTRRVDASTNCTAIKPDLRGIAMKVSDPRSSGKDDRPAISNPSAIGLWPEISGREQLHGYESPRDVYWCAGGRRRCCVWRHLDRLDRSARRR